MDTNDQVGMISICSTPGGPGPAATTVTGAGPLLTPSLVAEMVAVPGVTPVTTPFGATTATFGSLLTQRTGRRTTLPCAFLPTARSANVRLTVTLIRRGCTSSEATVVSATGARATGAVTVTDAVPVRPSAVALTEAAPAFSPLTVPSGMTLATVESLEAQVKGRGRTCPFVPWAVAASATVPPTVMATVAGVTLILARVTAGGLASDRTTNHNPTAAAAASGTAHQNRAARASAPAVRTSTAAVPL